MWITVIAWRNLELGFFQQITQEKYILHVIYNERIVKACFHQVFVTAFVFNPFCIRTISIALMCQQVVMLFIGTEFTCSSSRKLAARCADRQQYIVREHLEHLHGDRGAALVNKKERGAYSCHIR